MTVTKSVLGCIAVSEQTELHEQIGTNTMKSVQGKRFGIFFVNL